MHDPLLSRFPEMTPVTSPPALSTINGIGTGVYGRRDSDPETGTYVTTLCFCVLFIPLLALRAYRVADANPGWYFLGKVPLSGFARGWNYLLLLTVVGAIGLGVWSSATSGAAYRAQAKLDEGDEHRAAGELHQAAKSYRAAMTLHPPASTEAIQKLDGLLDDARGKPPTAVVPLLTELADLERTKRVLPHLWDCAVALALACPPEQPQPALQMLDAVAHLAPEEKVLAAQRTPLLERLAKQRPDDVAVLSDLALAWENQRRVDDCELLLAPHAAKLGDREGARILGQIYVRKGKAEAALPLLTAYAQERLKRHQRAEADWHRAVAELANEVKQQLGRRQAPGLDFALLERADKATQDRLLKEYYRTRFKEDPRLKTISDALRRDSPVVGAALDLGFLHLQRGQAETEPGKRQHALEQAEKAFLAVSGAAGQSIAYRLSLGKVYYWLGKHAAGQMLFDEVLQTDQGSAVVACQVANALRQVGETARAKSLLEAAYTKELTVEKKQEIAESRAVMATELDERVLWLERCNASHTSTRANLATVKGLQAHQNNEEARAAALFREAIALYESMLETDVTLNNCALIYLNLYQSTGDRATLQEARRRLARAYALKQDDAVQLYNIITQKSDDACRTIIGAQIELGLIREFGSVQHFDFLCRDAAGRNQLRTRLRQDPAFAQLQADYERLLLLSPKKAEVYSQLAQLHRQLGNDSGLEKVRQRLREITLDVHEQQQRLLERYGGKNDAKRLQEWLREKTTSQQRLEAARQVGGATLAVAVNNCISRAIQGDALSQPSDPRALLALAEEAVKAAPSRGSERLLRTALLFSAHLELREREPAYAELAKKSQRVLSPNALLALALAQDSKLRQACLAHSAVQRVFAELRRTCADDPESCDEWTWAMLRHAFPEDAAALAGKLSARQSAQTYLEIRRLTEPLNADLAYQHCWSLQLRGAAAKTQAILAEFAKQGVPLPTMTP